MCIQISCKYYLKEGKGRMLLNQFLGTERNIVAMLNLIRGVSVSLVSQILLKNKPLQISQISSHALCQLQKWKCVWDTFHSHTPIHEIHKKT